MYANGTTNKKETHSRVDGGLGRRPESGRSGAVEPNQGGISRSHDLPHAMDFVHNPTLMEFVVDFLERYNDAPCGHC
jgi:hypothetical protein